MRGVLLAVLGMLYICVTMAQEIHYRVEFNAAAVADGRNAPFWHISNRQGLGSIDGFSSYTRIAVKGRQLHGNGNWRVEFCADIVLMDEQASRAFIQQSYTDVGYKMFTLSIGQKERWNSLKNHRLTTGGLTESGNARPVPQVRIEIPRYWDIFGTKGWFSVRGHIAYGWFTDEEWQKDFVATGKARTVGVRYHSKAGYFKIGNERRFPLTYEFGLEMAAQFGGTVYNMHNEPGRHFHNPAGIKDYWKVFVPMKGDSDYHGMDKANIAGNQLGSWHTALTWHDSGWLLRAYYEHLFDDHSQMFWEYGLWKEQLVGLELKLRSCKWIDCVVIEYFNLKNHSGPIYHDSSDEIPDQISCGDNNYNHSWYNGWFNYGMMIGNPLCTSPIYNTDGVLTCYNNRLEAFHFGIEGAPTKRLEYRLLLTKSNNWGTYSHPFTEIKENIAGMIELTYSPKSLKGWNVRASLAFDNGNLHGNSTGGMVSISKRGIIKF